MTYEQLVEGIKNLGLNKDQQDGVIQLMHEGMDVRVTPRGFEMRAGKMVIKTFNANGDDADGTEPIRGFNFLLEADGIDPLQVRSITIPKLDYAESDQLTIGVELLPYVPELPNAKKKAS